MYKRPVFKEIVKRIKEKRRFIQVLAGPRQTGKTTIARQVLDEPGIEGHYAAADEPMLKDRVWAEQQWETARIKSKKAKKPAVLVLDEIHKIPMWAETIKRLWDEDTAAKSGLRVILLGSSPLLMNRGLGESLAGRFEPTHITHWPYEEMEKAFGWGAEKYIFYGGYPGSAGLIKDPERFNNYILESLVESVISKDILQMKRVDKPALLREVFRLGCAYSGQVLSYQKMLGQLQDAGNTTTLAHYLRLLEEAGMLAGLQKYSGETVRQRGSSPKFQVFNNAFLTALAGYEQKQAIKDSGVWGRLVESCVGAHLINGIKGKNIRLCYWAGYNREVDFVLIKGNRVTALEVKSGRKKSPLPGMGIFSGKFRVHRKLLIGTGGVQIDDFLKIPAQEWVK